MKNCPECGSVVSDRMKKCPNCGYPMEGIVDKYSQFYGKPKHTQLYQPEKNYAEEKESRPQVRLNSKSTSLSISAIIFSLMGLLTSLIAIVIASSKPKEVYIEREVPVYLESGQEESISDIEGPETEEEDIIVESSAESEDWVQEESFEEQEDITDKEDEEVAEVSNVFYVGDVLETKKIRLSYIACGDYIDENMFIDAGAGNKFIYFEFEFTNIGSTDTSVGYYDFDCYADGYEAKSSICTDDNAMTSITTLSPGRRMSGIVVFEVPDDSEIIEVEYETSFWTQDKAIFMYE